MNAKLGLKNNWQQFSLLVLINAFVGGMVGLERTILPGLASSEFNIAANTAILSFIIVFGIAKAITNYFTGMLANKFGRRNLLIAGWVVGLPVPLIIIFADHWYLVILANILLGINQGLAWSSTVVMKIDLVGEKQRGLAMGLNESAGYLAVGIVAFFTAWMAEEYGLRPFPFYIGIGFAIIGLLLSVFFVQDTVHHVNAESTDSNVAKLTNVFKETTWSNPNLGSISQAGLINNLNDGMIWGLFPVLLATKGFDLVTIGRIVAIYPIIWGLGQLITGKVADLTSKKMLLFWGMLMQGVVLLTIVYTTSFVGFVLIGVVLGIGTALVYPTFLAAIADYTHPQQRAESIGVFRLWRDLGYAVGAILTGVIADLIGINYAILSIGLLTVLSSFIIQFRMNK